MITQASPFSALRRLHRSAMAWLGTWWRLLHFAVLIVATALTPASYGGIHRPALARRIVIAAAPNLLWFTVLSALVSLVLIRIVVVTALSYGLSRFALEMVVRVLVLELIPLTAALFVALRSTLPAGVEFAQQRGAGGLYPGTTINSAALLHSEFFPRVAAGMFAVWVLAALSLYGFTPWALQGYTRVVGQVFDPSVALILVLKVVFFSVAVGLIPMASSYYDGIGSRLRATHGLSDMVRLFSLILLIEVASLMGNYY